METSSDSAQELTDSLQTAPGDGALGDGEQPYQYDLTEEQLALIDTITDASISSDKDVEKLANGLFDADPVAEANRQRIEEIRQLSGHDPEGLIEEQKKLLATWEDIVAVITNHPLERHRRQEELNDARWRSIKQIESLGENPDVEVVTEQIFDADGRIPQGEEGRIALPAFVVKEFSDYCLWVSDQEREMTHPKDEYSIDLVKAMDNTRKSLHDTVARSLQQLLQFPGWQSEQYRQVVAGALERVSATRAHHLAQSRTAAFR